MTLTPANKYIVDSVIKDDEGSWKLTANANDPDGGWTFAGVTKTTWIKYKGNELRQWNYEDMAKHIAENFNDIATTIYEIYADEYLIPCVSILKNASYPWVSDLGTKYVSCIINVGQDGFTKIIKNCKKPGKDHGDYPDFCYHWMMYYIHLVQENAEAWQTYARDTAKNLAPKTLRSENLAGWFNRVERYR